MGGGDTQGRIPEEYTPQPRLKIDKRHTLPPPPQARGRSQRGVRSLSPPAWPRAPATRSLQLGQRLHPALAPPCPLSTRSLCERRARAAAPIGRRPRPSARGGAVEKATVEQGGRVRGGRRRRLGRPRPASGGGSGDLRARTTLGPAPFPVLRPVPGRPPAPRSPVSPRARRRGPCAGWRAAQRLPKPCSRSWPRWPPGPLTFAGSHAGRRAGPGPGRRDAAGRGGRAQGPRPGKVSAPAAARRRLAAALFPCFDHHLISTGNDMENGRKRRLGQTRTPQFRGPEPGLVEPRVPRAGPARELARPRRAPHGKGDAAEEERAAPTLRPGYFRGVVLESCAVCASPSEGAPWLCPASTPSVYRPIIVRGR